MRFSVTIDDSDWRRKQAQLIGAIPGASRKGLQELAEKVKLKAKQLAIPHPGSDTGGVASAIHYRTIPSVTDISAKLFINDIAAVTANNGRAPGGPMPPIGEMRDWAARHGIDTRKAFIIARGISRKGTKGLNFMKDASDQASSLAPQTANQIKNDIITGIGNSYRRFFR